MKKELERPIYIVKTALEAWSELTRFPLTTKYLIEHVERKDIRDVYYNMMLDPHISSVIMSRKAGVLHERWYIKGEPPEEAMKLTKMIAPIVYKILNNLLNAVAYGYAVVELIYNEQDNMLVPTKVVARPWYWFVYKEGEFYFQDRYGEPHKLIPEKVIIYQNSPDENFPAGMPLLLKAYLPYYLKRIGVQNWATLGERFAIPTIWGKYSGTLSDEEADKLLNALVRLQKLGAALVPGDIEIQPLEVKLEGRGELFQKLTNFLNAEISKLFLGQTLTTEIAEKGTYAAAKVHLRVREDILYADMIGLQEVMTTYINRLAKLNNMQGTFEFVFDMSPKPELRDILESAKAGIPISKSWFYKYTGIQEPENDDDILPVTGGIFKEGFKEIVTFVEEDK